MHEIDNRGPEIFPMDETVRSGKPHKRKSSALLAPALSVAAAGLITLAILENVTIDGPTYIPEPPVTQIEVPSDPPPVTAPPVTVPPITAPPITVPPVTVPPITAPPVTVPPVTVPPVTEPPVTAPPITAPPFMVPPTTAPKLEYSVGYSTDPSFDVGKIKSDPDHPGDPDYPGHGPWGH